MALVGHLSDSTVADSEVGSGTDRDTRGIPGGSPYVKYVQNQKGIIISPFLILGFSTRL